MFLAKLGNNPFSFSHFAHKSTWEYKTLFNISNPTAKAIYNWKFVHRYFVALNWNAGCVGYLDNFKILSILTFPLRFSFALGLEKLRQMPRYNYVLIKLPNFVFVVVWRLTLFCLLRGDVYQRSTSGNPTSNEPTILRESDTVQRP